MSKLFKRDPMKELWVEMRIKLPFCMKHQPASAKDGCNIFNSVRIVEYENSECHLHVELVKDTQDNFKHEKEILPVHNAVRAVPSPIINTPSSLTDNNDINIPTTIETLNNLVNHEINTVAAITPNKKEKKMIAQKLWVGPR